MADEREQWRDPLGKKFDLPPIYSSAPYEQGGHIVLLTPGAAKGDSAWGAYRHGLDPCRVRIFPEAGRSGFAEMRNCAVAQDENEEQET